MAPRQTSVGTLHLFDSTEHTACIPRFGDLVHRLPFLPRAHRILLWYDHMYSCITFYLRLHVTFWYVYSSLHIPSLLYLVKYACCSKVFGCTRQALMKRTMLCLYCLVLCFVLLCLV